MRALLLTALLAALVASPAHAETNAWSIDSDQPLDRRSSEVIFALSATLHGLTSVSFAPDTATTATNDWAYSFTAKDGRKFKQRVAFGTNGKFTVTVVTAGSWSVDEYVRIAGLLTEFLGVYYANGLRRCVVTWS